jgi:hypothetical protein
VVLAGVEETKFERWPTVDFVNQGGYLDEIGASANDQGQSHRFTATTWKNGPNT